MSDAEQPSAAALETGSAGAPGPRPAELGDNTSRALRALGDEAPRTNEELKRLVEPDDPHVPWTIKSIRTGLRLQAVNAAKAEGLTMGEWMERAIPAQAARDKENKVFPPGQAGQSLTKRPEAAEAEPGKLFTVGAEPDLHQLGGIEQLAHLAVSLAERADLPGIGPAAKQASALLRDRLRQARGLRPRSTSRPAVAALPALAAGAN